jgi:type IV pilus assembly protein PilZ
VLEKRGHPRATVQADLICRRADGSSFAARAKDLSVGGMFVLSQATVTFGEELTIELTPDGSRKSMSLPAVVRWTQENGFGVQFGLLGARDTHAISELTRR